MTGIELLKQLQEEVPICTLVAQDAQTREAYLEKTLTFYHLLVASKLFTKEELKLIKKIRDKLNDCWINYLYGRVNTASSQMQNLLNLNIGSMSYLDLLKGKKGLPKLLYRGRINKAPFSSIEAYYHIPFNKRYLIKNQRYSLSGIPCLYFASSIEGMYAELGQKKEVHYSIAHPSKSLAVFDLSIGFEQLLKQQRIQRKQLLQFLYTLPLKYACSIQAEDNQFSDFKTNYIVPQLMTAALYNKNTDYDGICYASIKGKELPYEQRLNFVFLPQYQLGKQMYDLELLQKFVFEMTEKTSPASNR